MAGQFHRSRGILMLVAHSPRWFSFASRGRARAAKIPVYRFVKAAVSKDEHCNTDVGIPATMEFVARGTRLRRATDWFGNWTLGSIALAAQRVQLKIWNLISLISTTCYATFHGVRVPGNNHYTVILYSLFCSRLGSWTLELWDGDR